jgi:hypothetical protein
MFKNPGNSQGKREERSFKGRFLQGYRKSEEDVFFFVS